MSNKIKIPKANKGKGYVGTWSNNVLGWHVPNHLQGGRATEKPSRFAKQFAQGGRFFLCEITIKPVLDKKGRPITKIVK